MGTSEQKRGRPLPQRLLDYAFGSMAKIEKKKWEGKFLCIRHVAHILRHQAIICFVLRRIPLIMLIYLQ